jgi:hypothetical protein
MMVNLLGSIDADKISKALAASSKEPPSLLAIGDLEGGAPGDGGWVGLADCVRRATR